MLLTIKVPRSWRILVSKLPNLGHFEELFNLYCGQICVEKFMRFVCFKLPFRPNFVRLCMRHPSSVSEGIIEWLLLMVRVKKGYKTRQTSLTYVSRDQTHCGQMAIGAGVGER
jgi:hypothetical protein